MQVHFSLSQKVGKILSPGAVPTIICLCRNARRKPLSISQSANIQSPSQQDQNTTQFMCNLAPVDHQHYCKTVSHHQVSCPLHKNASNTSQQKPKVSEPTPDILKLRQENEKLMKEARSLHEHLMRDKSLTSFSEKFSEAQVAAVVSGNSRGRKWPLADVRSAMTLAWTGGPSALDVTQRRQNVAPLPSVRTIQRRTAHIKFEPGILREVLDAFEPTVNAFVPLDRDCALFFDDMSITMKRDMDPSTGKYIGDVTLPGVTGMASKTTVYMFAGIRARWKVTAAYHNVPDKVHPDIQAQVIKDVISEGSRLQLNVLAIVCDMGNRGVTNALGFSTKKNMLCYSVPHPCDPTKPLFLVPDGVHVYKSVKEGLVNNGSFTISDSLVQEYNLPSNTVDISHVQWLHDHQDDMDLQFAPQLSSKHIQASHFNKMKSASARNVLNHKVACSLKLKVMTGEAPPAYTVTSWFISVMNRWFDIMTCRSLQLAFSKKNETAYQDALNDLKLTVKLFKNIKFNGGWKPVQTHIIAATEAILAIQDYLINVQGYEFVIAGRFLQDVVENMFSLVRRKRPNPTALQVKQSLRQIVIGRLSGKVKGASYDLDDREDPVDLMLTAPSKQQSTLDSIPNIPPWVEPVPSSPILSKGQELVLYRMCGYVVNKLVERLTLKCQGCITALQHQGPEPHPMSLWVKTTNYGGGEHQISVSNEVFQLLRRVEYNLLRCRSMLVNLKTAALSVIMSLFMPHLLSSSNLTTCHDVREVIVKYWVNMRLKQMTTDLTGRKLVQPRSQLSSKSMGSRLLSDRYRTGPEKCAQSPPAPLKYLDPPVLGQPSGGKSKSDVCVKVKVPAIGFPSRRRKKENVPPLTENFLKNVSAKLNAFNFTKSSEP